MKVSHTIHCGDTRAEERSNTSDIIKEALKNLRQQEMEQTHATQAPTSNSLAIPRGVVEQSTVYNPSAQPEPTH